MKKVKGFTLIELLIAISIIALLAAISLSTFSNLQKNSRDAKRKSDLKVIQSALQQYHSDQGFYPESIIISSPLTDVEGSRTYLTEVPTDPLEPVNWAYGYSGLSSIGSSCNNGDTVCTKYCLYAYTENSNNGLVSSACEDRMVPGGDKSYNYEITQP